MCRHTKALLEMLITNPIQQKKKAEQKSGTGNNIQVIGKKQNMQGENKKQINKIAKYKRLVLTGIKDT